MTYVPLPGDGTPHVVTLIPGDGIGPEVTDSVTKVVEALGAPIIWERCGPPPARGPGPLRGPPSTYSGGQKCNRRR